MATWRYVAHVKDTPTEVSEFVTPGEKTTYWDFGLESEQIVVEERLVGEEVTIFALTDGVHLEIVGHVFNYPRLGDGESGPPTRGMGQVCPAPQIDDALLAHIRDEVLIPTVAEMAHRGHPLRGALFVDIMLVGGRPYVIDYNVRFGDPATQTILSAYQGDLYAALRACQTGEGLAEAVSALHRDPRPRMSVVVACAGYPDKMVRGAPITLHQATFDADPDLWLFTDGVRVRGSAPETTGGRTYTVVAAGDTLAAARARAYAGVAAITFDGKHFRTDIGAGL